MMLIILLILSRAPFNSKRFVDNIITNHIGSITDFIIKNKKTYKSIINSILRLIKSTKTMDMLIKKMIKKNMNQQILKYLLKVSPIQPSKEIKKKVDRYLK
jgi:hypothetical protein